MLLPTLLIAASSWAAAAAPNPQAVEKEVSGIIDLFYDLRFEEASQAAKTLELHFPGHPAGPFYAALVSYQLYLQNVSSSEEALASFDKDSARAIDAAQALAQAEPAVSEYYLGAALGFQSRALVSGKHYVAAISKARPSIKHLKKAWELDPSLEGAQLGIGMYDYFMSRVPLAFRPFAFAAMGSWGNRKRGLEELLQVAASSAPARMEARAVLSAIYASKKERLWPKAEELLKELSARYPGNPLYRLRLAYVLEQEGRWTEAEQTADPESGWTQKLNPVLEASARAAGALRKAEALLFEGKPELAKKELESLNAASLPPKLEIFFQDLRRSYPKPPWAPTPMPWPLAGLPTDHH
jgi:hypothetical protein